MPRRSALEDALMQLAILDDFGDLIIPNADHLRDVRAAIRAVESHFAAKAPAETAAFGFQPECFDAAGAAHYVGERNRECFMRLAKREPELQKHVRLHGRTGLRWHKRDLDAYLARRHGTVAAAGRRLLSDILS